MLLQTPTNKKQKQQMTNVTLSSKISLKDIYKYRFFILHSVKTDFLTRFAKSKLGVLWAVINPLMQVLIYAIILSSVLSSKLPGVSSKYAYAIYLMSGMLAWSLFSEILLGCTSIFVQQANIIKKISFPLIILPLKVILAALINHALLLACILIVFALLGHIPTISIFAILPLSLIPILIAASLGAIFGMLNVFTRDILHLVNILMQFAFWLTPIVYMINIIPAKFAPFLMANPMLFVVEAYHSILIYNKLPQLHMLIYPTIFAIFCFLLAARIYSKAATELADYL